MMIDFVKIIYKNENFAYLWIIFLFLFLITFIFVGLNKYEQSSYYIGYADNNNIKLLIEEHVLTSLPEDAYFNDKKYDYEIKELTFNGC